MKIEFNASIAELFYCREIRRHGRKRQVDVGRSGYGNTGDDKDPSIFSWEESKGDDRTRRIDESEVIGYGKKK